MKNKILIFTGDPISVNSEVLIKVWKKLPKNLKKKIFIISNFKLLEAQFKKLKYKVKLNQIERLYENTNNINIKIINVDLSFNNPFKIKIKNLKRYVIKSLNLAHNIMIKDKKFIGLINCPIRKNLISDKGYGVTEFLAAKCLVKNNTEIMLIKNNKLAVSPITTHIDLRKISKKLSKEIIISKVKSINNNYKKVFKKKPVIAILGLNPHNAELKKNSEEKKIIVPAISFLKKLKIKVYGPYVSDTIFINDYKKFDVIVGMYHDQVLAPFKALYKFNAINITLGLKYLRLSPDHGVASKLIGKNKANPESLLECIKNLVKLK